MVDRISGNGNANAYINTVEYKQIKEEHPDAVFDFDAETGKLSWTEKSGGFFNKSTTGGSVYVDVSPSEEDMLAQIGKDMDAMSLEKYIDAGFVTKKGNGKYYEVDLEKMKEALGKDVTLADVKEMFGLADGALTASNDNIYFKDAPYDNKGQYAGRSLDDANISDVVHGNGKIKISAKDMFKTNGFE
ncbi:MAG: hypothetical protein MJ229_04385 [bacterium]|nr:hypothetical protein [bacterium]